MSGDGGCIPSGISGLDELLNSGLPRGRSHLIRGLTGTGKTTLGLQFALAGARNGERSLYLTLAETVAEIRGIADSHGWSIDGLEVVQQEAVRGGETPQTVLLPTELELPATVDAMLETIESVKPLRLVIDSLSELRAMAGDARSYRRELLRLGRRLRVLDCTCLLLDTGEGAETAASLIGSVIQLDSRTQLYGADRRRLHVVKMRGHSYATGYHDVQIRRGGLRVYPRLVAARHRELFSSAVVSTGLPGLDAMLGGGLDKGTAVLLLGSTGTGKSSLAFRCATAAVERGETVLAYVFDERLQTVFQRCDSLGIDLRRHVENGSIAIRQIDPAELTPGQFAHDVRRSVMDDGAGFVLIDSLNAYLYAMPEERLLNLHLHELLAFLSQRGVVSMLVCTQHGLDGASALPAELDVSYLADTVILHGMDTSASARRKVISVFKRRSGPHQEVVRQLRFDAGRLSVGPPIDGNRVPRSPDGPPGAVEDSPVGH